MTRSGIQQGACHADAPPEAAAPQRPDAAAAAGVPESRRQVWRTRNSGGARWRSVGEGIQRIPATDAAGGFHGGRRGGGPADVSAPALRARFTSPQLGVLQLLLGSFLISFSAVFVKIAHVGPTSAGFYRQAFGTVALLVIVAARRDRMWAGWTPLAFAWLAAAFFTADIYAWHRSILHVGPGLATILGNFQVVCMAAAGIFLFREHVTWRFLVSIPLAIAGLVLLVGLDWGSLGPGYRLGVVLGLLTAIAYASYLLTLRRAQRAVKRLGAAANLTWITFGTAVGLGTIGLAEGDSLAIPDTQTWIVLIAYGVVCQALGWVIISRALRKVDASRTGLILLTQPTLTFIWDILFFRRPTSAVEAAGAVLALGAIYLGNTGRGRRGSGAAAGDGTDAASPGGRRPPTASSDPGSS
jgi:drug/metabolite transporter (DMT)-like permease